MADTKLILVCKDKSMIEDVTKILVASGNIREDEIEAWEEKTWEVKAKGGPIGSKVLLVGDIKDSTPLSCFIDIKYERWGILYGVNPRYALITAETIYIKDNARYQAFMTDYNDTVGKVLEAPAEDQSNKVAKTIGTVGLAVATGGASLAAQKLYDDNKVLTEKSRQLCLFGVWHFARNTLGELIG
ncbi:hypothetical protein SAMN02910264_02075 [Ruminococcaceae bacterium YAD3003]|jgi:hypothetical protein|nr:hypothetical protein SAMN02910264_02075 [Ruminococcaceae bacterium YAD3003]